MSTVINFIQTHIPENEKVYDKVHIGIRHVIVKVINHKGVKVENFVEEAASFINKEKEGHLENFGLKGLEIL